ncbi:MAG: major outer membrane protein, partial [Aliarcobacter sp.]|nr:major outer membrane protein [Aliarcobacter sp.]
AKLSLVAAVAVAGLTTANAQSLEDAIKNVETSGSVVYRYNDYKNDVTDGSDTNNNYKVALNLSSKVNEDVKFNSRFLVANNAGTFAGGTMDTQNGGDSNPEVTLSHANFAYTGIANTTITAGKQGLATPWTVAIDSDGNEQTGSGILALTTVGPVTLAAAYFNQTNLDKLDVSASAFTPAKVALNKSADIATVGAIANLDAVTLDAWYLDLADTFDSYTVGAKADLDLSDVKLGVDARYASLNLDNVNADNAMAKIALTAKAGIVNGKVAYAWTDKEGGLTALDNDANTTLLGWNLTSNNKADADYWQAVIGVDILSNLNLSANYGNLDYVEGTTSLEEEEIYAQLVYKMSKNLSTYVRYGTYSKESTAAGARTVEINDDVRGRAQIEYTF